MVLMAKYEYRCIECSEYELVEHPIKEEHDAPNCIKCNDPMVRIWSSVGAIFKGSGFYSTDK